MSDIPLTAPIVPNPGSQAQSTYAKYVSEGWINVANHAARDALHTGVTTVGTLARTLNDGIVWEVMSVGPVVWAPWSGSGGVTSFATRTGAVVPLSNDYSADQVTNDSSVPGTGVKGALNTLLGLLGAGPTPFKATLYVDPTFSGVSTGSQSNPFPSHTAAIAVAPSTGARLVQAPGTNSTENVTFPTTGNWEIASDYTGSGRDIATVITKITGNLVCTTGGVVLTNVLVTGNVTGNAVNTVSGSTLTLKNTVVLGAVALTASAGAFWLTFLSGDPAWPNGNVGCAVSGAFSIAGNVAAENAYFGSTLELVSVSRLTNCRLNGNITLSLYGGVPPAIAMLGTTWPNNPLTITGTGTTSVEMDGYTASGKFALSGCVLQLRNAVAPFRATLHVDPLFVAPAGVSSNGAPSSPYTSITAAIAAAPSTGALIILAPLANTTEDVTFPTTGFWEVLCHHTQRATITGNVVCSSVVQCSYRFTNVVVTGTISGLAANTVGSAANFLILTNSQILGSVSLTQTALGFWFVMLRGSVTNFFALGGFVGPINVAGQLFAGNWNFAGAVTTNSIGGCDNCRFAGGGSALITILAGGGLSLTNTVFVATPQFVGPGGVVMDGFTYARAGGTSAGLTSGATITLSNIAGQFASTFYVNPGYTGASNGSAGAPYTTVNAAIAAAPLTGSLIVLAEGTHSASITFPANGIYTLTSNRDRLFTDVTLSGAITIPATTNVEFSDVQISGNITTTGTSGSGSYIILDGSLCSGNITATSGGFMNVVVKSTAVAKRNIYVQGWTTGTINIRGRLIAEKALIQSDVTAGAILASDTEFDGVHTINTLNPAGISAAFGMDLRGGCSFTAGWTYTGPVSGSVRFSDPATALNWATSSPILTNATTLVYGFQTPLTTLSQGGATGVNLQALMWNGFAWAPNAVVSAVTSVFGRLGAVVAAVGDYAASKINNDSATVAGLRVSDALDSLKALIVASATGVSSVFGRTGAVVAAAGDYAASKINNDSLTILGPHVSDALDALLLEYQSAPILATGRAFVLADVGTAILANSPGIITFTIPANATLGFKIGSKITVINISNGTIVIAPAAGVSISLGSALPTAPLTAYTCEKLDTNSWRVSAYGVLDAGDITDLSSSVGGPSVRASVNFLNSTIAALTSNDIANASTVVAVNVSDALDVTKQRIDNLTSDEIDNESDIFSAVNVSDAINYLLNRSMIGESQLPIIPVVGVGSGWVFPTGLGFGWQGIGLNDDLICALGPIPVGAVITGIRVRIAPQHGHSDIPNFRPGLRLYKFTSDSSSYLSSTIGVGGDFSANVAAYETPHDIAITGLSVPTAGSSFSFAVRDEGGTFSIPGLWLISATLTLA